MPAVAEEKELSEAEERILLYWHEILGHVHKDLANVWIDKCKEDFKKMSLKD